MLQRNSGVAKRFRPVINLCYEDDLIPVLRSDAEAPQCMNNVHFHLTVGVAGIGIVDELAKGFMV